MSKKTREQLQKQYRKYLDEPNMSDKNLLVSVEDLINGAFGPVEQNTVNFKLVQMIMHILARQMRILEQEVEIKFDEIGVERKADKELTKDKYQQYSEESSDVIVEEEERDDRDEDVEGGEKEGDREKRREKKSKDKADRSKDREKKGRGKSGERDDRGGRGGDSDEGRDSGQEGQRGGDRAGEQRGTREGERGADREDKTGRGADREDKTARGADREDQTARGADREDRTGRGADREDRTGRGADQSGERGGGRRGDKSGDRGGKAGKGERGGERGKKGRPSQSESGSQGKGPDKESSRTSIILTETQRKGGKGPKDKILVVEKGPTTRADSRTRVGSIEVVTASQFSLLENAVKQLMTVAGPLPMPALPENAKLRQDLAKGTASLTETMQAMQLNARVQAAEEALTRMAGLLTQLAAAGALPEDMTNRLGAFEAELQQAAAAAAAMTATVTAGAHPAGQRTVGTGPVSGGQGGARTGQGAAGTRQGMAGTGQGAAGMGQGAAGMGQEARGPGQGRPGTGQDAGGTGRPGAAGGVGAGGTGVEAHAGAGGYGGPGATRMVEGGFGHKSVAIDSSLPTPQMGSRPDSAWSDQKSGTTATPSSASAGVSAATSAAISLAVTHPEMDDMLQLMKERLLKDIATMTTKATNSSENASNIAKSVADNLEIALKLDKRINVLYSQTADYAEQLSGFDSGLTTQMASFQEQMLQMRTDLKGGLAQLDQANNNAETTALAELNERYEGLVIDLDTTLHAHTELTALQRQLSEELRSLVECVENLREQKADRDEVFDGLKDKADITRLAGLLHEIDFGIARAELEERLEMCYEKFRKQDLVWLDVIADLTLICEGKAEILELLAMKDNTTDELRRIQETLRKLFVMLGEPKAAILMRKLAKGAVCAGCLVPALMEPVDLNHGKPFPLPRLRPPPVGEDSCLTEVHMPVPPDAREHVCRRWVGGSHTLMSDNVTRVRAAGLPVLTAPTKKYTGYGSDGRVYMLEEELQPCLECNIVGLEKPEGAGEGGPCHARDPPGAKGAGGAGGAGGAEGAGDAAGAGAQADAAPSVPSPKRVESAGDQGKNNSGTDNVPVENEPDTEKE